MRDDLLCQGLEKLGLNVSPSALSKLDTYIKEIELFNPAYRLVSCADRDELVIRHILDCAAGVPVIASCLGPDRTVADFGSGAGLPGVVLACLMEDVDFVLVERMKRRVDFLNNVRLCSSLDNVTILPDDISTVSGTFSCITFRAFHPLYDIISQLDRLLAEEGTVCAYKAHRTYVMAEAEGLDGFSFSLVPLKVPFLDEERNMMVLKRRCSDEQR